MTRILKGYTFVTERDIKLINYAIKKWGSMGSVARDLGYNTQRSGSSIIVRIITGHTKQIRLFGLERLYKSMGKVR